MDSYFLYTYKTKTGVIGLCTVFCLLAQNDSQTLMLFTFTLADSACCGLTFCMFIWSDICGVNMKSTGNVTLCTIRWARRLCKVFILNALEHWEQVIIWNFSWQKKNTKCWVRCGARFLFVSHPGPNKLMCWCLAQLDFCFVLHSMSDNFRKLPQMPGIAQRVQYQWF